MRNESTNKTLKRMTRSAVESPFRGQCPWLPHPYLMLAVLVMPLLASGGRVHAADCYETIGYLTYTTLDASGKPTGKNVLMFDVRISCSQWHIRTEPVVECKNGIGYFEASPSTNGFILAVTAFADA